VRSQPVVEVEWVDSMARTGWQRQATWRPEETVLTCRTVGWLHYQDDERVVLVQSYMDSGSMDNALHIPRRAVLDLRIVEDAP
jgi:hypothetical protein